MASHKAIISGLSGRYAVALFELAEKAGQLDAIAADLTTLKAAIADSEDFRRLLISPLIGRSAQKKAVLSLAGLFKLNQLAANFMGVLAANGRLSVLSRIIRDFFVLLSDHRGEVSAHVTSAAPLTEEQLDALRISLKSAVGRDVAIEAHVDQDLLGGLLVRVGSRMIDSSLKTKLDNLKVAMKGVQ